MNSPLEAVPQAPPELARPVGESLFTNDNARQQALALLDLERPAGRRADAPQHDLPIGDIHQVIAKHAPNAHRNGRHGAPPAEYERTKPSDAAPQHAEPPLEPAKRHLLELASDKLKDNPAALNAFKQNMQDFEKRMMSLSPVEVQRTYTELARLMETHGAKVSESDRTLLAQQIMRNAAHPEVGISQGLSNTCVSASLESRAYAKAPAEAAKMVVDLALTGSFTNDGRTIKPTTGISQPINNDGYDSPGRSFASQIFQVGAMNIYADMINQSSHPPGQYRYALEPSDDKARPFKEHLYNDATHPPTDQPVLGVQTDDAIISAMYTAITGRNEGTAFLSSTSVSSLVDFKDRLEAARRQGDFPIVLSIDPAESGFRSQLDQIRNSPWYKKYHEDHPDEILIPSFGQHAITIQSYDPKTGKITFTDPEFPDRKQETDINTMALNMHVTLYPDEQQRYFEFEQRVPQKDRFSTESEVNYLASLPPRERQAQFDRLYEMRYLRDLTKAQLRALGIVSLHPDPEDDDGN